MNGAGGNPALLATVIEVWAAVIAAASVVGGERDRPVFEDVLQRLAAQLLGQDAVQPQDAEEGARVAIGQAGCRQGAVDLRDVIVAADLEELREEVRRADANAEPVAYDRAHPGADLPAIGAETEAIDDLLVGLGVAGLDGGHQIAQHAGLARQLPGGQGEGARLLDGVCPGEE